MDNIRKRKHHHHNVYSIDFYASHSALKDVNAGLKAITAVMTLILCIAFNSVVISSAIIVSMGAFTVIKGKIQLKHYIGFMLIPITFILLSSAAIAVNLSTYPVRLKYLKIGFLYAYVSHDSLLTAILVSSKALGSISALYMLTLSTLVGELITVLEKSHLPKVFTSLMDMIYRFIFILSEQVNSMTVSARSRLGYIGFLRSCRTFGNITGNLFIISLKKANTTYDAMISRCYDGELSFLHDEKPIKCSQIIIVILYFAALIFLHIYTY
ncbi:MAG: cobalt ECF transporter T component CbiQ [Candidatus Metalachnospira sp.]|nr:cobalt ECF transporter T component CbiQ [Candidatus Metalachnospira sp.]